MVFFNTTFWGNSVFVLYHYFFWNSWNVHLSLFFRLIPGSSRHLLQTTRNDPRIFFILDLVCIEREWSFAKSGAGMFIKGQKGNVHMLHPHGRTMIKENIGLCRKKGNIGNHVREEGLLEFSSWRMKIILGRIPHWIRSVSGCAWSISKKIKVVLFPKIDTRNTFGDVGSFDAKRFALFRRWKKIELAMVRDDLVLQFM